MDAFIFVVAGGVYFFIGLGLGITSYESKKDIVEKCNSSHVFVVKDKIYKCTPINTEKLLGD